MKEIGLTKGYVALVDDADYEAVSQHKWYPLPVVRKDGTVRTVYARRNTVNAQGKRTQEYMHRFLLGLTDPKIEADHRDGDGLNCQRYNLRSATHKQNLANQRLGARNTTGSKGVVKHPKGGFQVFVGHKYVGRFPTITAGERAYAKAATEAFGEFAQVAA